jgi:carboxyl-terminal processing protease
MRRRFLLPGLLAASISVSLLHAETAPPTPPEKAPAAAPAPAPAPEEDSYQATLLFTRVVELIRQDYVDGEKVAYKDLIYAALRGMLSSLDPHSQFLDEDAFAEMQRDTKGEFTGLGLILGTKDGALIVISALEGTPGYRAGILPGDRILKINETSTERLPYAAAVKALRGKRGEKVRMTLYRAPAKPPAKGVAVADGDAPENIYEVEMTRELIKVSTVKEVKLLPPETAGDEKIGYLRLEQFGENSVAEFDKALDDLQKQGARALVLDLRNDPGGLIDAAVDIAGEFLPPGTVVVSTQGRTEDSRREYRSRRDHPPVTYPLVVLVNGFSASGSEIVAGALQDLKRAVIVGETTFGKGSVQSVVSLGNGIGVRLTTAKYYTPNHRVIHEKGVEPDIAAPVTAAEERNLIRLRSPALLTAEEKLSLRGVRDSQLERAVAALRGILFHGDRAKAPAPAASPAPSPAPTPAAATP